MAPRLSGFCRIALVLAGVMMSATGRSAAADLPSPAVALEGGDTLKPAYPDMPLKGPAAAKGVVIWNHGANKFYGAKDITQSPPAVFVAVLREDDWDIYRIDRPTVDEEYRRSTRAIVEAVQLLKRQGYAKVVLAGQSAGAWLSVIAGGRSSDVHAIIGNAPAYYGTEVSYKRMNASVLYDNLADLERGRVMLAFFRDDAYDPGGRGERAETILARKGIAHLVIDRPEEFAGHGSGSSALFARRFGRCAVAVAGDGPVPTLEECADLAWGREPSATLPVPADLRVIAPSGTPADRYLGKWYGYYANGREVMLVVEQTDGAQASAAYLVGPSPDGALKGAFSRRHGQLHADGLVFEAEGQATLSYALRADGNLDAQWLAADGRDRLSAVLRRLP